jgi:hypothetical protein
MAICLYTASTVKQKKRKNALIDPIVCLNPLKSFLRNWRSCENFTIFKVQFTKN